MSDIGPVVRSAMLAIFACLGLVHASHAQGVFGGTSGLDPSFCKTHNIRQTVIYVDDMMLVTGQTEWARIIYNKLQATLVPGERVTLVELSPANGLSSEVWSGCWPAYTADEVAKLKSQGFSFHDLLNRNPLDELKDQQNFFAHAFGVAAEKIQMKGQRPAAMVVIDPNKPPQKAIIRALASDGARYAHSDSTVRAILYSDLAENSDLGSVFQPLTQSEFTYGQTLGTYLRRSVFYAFGLCADIEGGGKVQETARAFWQGALRSMSADVNGIGSDLNVPNTVPVTARDYDVVLDENGRDFSGRMYLLMDRDGTLVDSSIGIELLHNAAINGSFRCSGQGSNPHCTLQAKTETNVVSSIPNETLLVSGASTLTGKLGVQNSAVYYPIAATPATD